MRQDYYDQLIWEAARKDADYQALLARAAAAEEEYLKIRKSLPQPLQEQLEEYIALCQEMGHRMVQLALALPRDGH